MGMLMQAALRSGSGRTLRYASSLAVLVLVAVAFGSRAASVQAAQSHPDLSGAWTVYPSRAKGPPPDPKLMAPQPTELLLKSKYAAAYEAKRAAQRESDKRGEPLANASTECIPNGMPQMMFPIYPIEILQTHGQVTIIAEAMSQVRRIFLDQPQTRIEETPPTYFGHSVGHWEGDTLLVDTVGVKEEVLGYRDIPHSDQMRIKERFHLVAPDVLHDEITVEDPEVLEKPWTFTFAYKRSQGYQMLEYVCDNNREYVDDKGVTRMRLQNH
jgi:hypothetical protein